MNIFNKLNHLHYDGKFLAKTYQQGGRFLDYSYELCCDNYTRSFYIDKWFINKKYILESI